MGLARTDLMRGLAVAGALAVVTAASVRVTPANPPSPDPPARHTASAQAKAIPEPALCFAPGTSNEVVRRASLRASRVPGFGPAGYQYFDGTRWSCTATDGCGHTEGQPTVLTWSVVPDETPLEGAAGEPSNPSDLRWFLTNIYGSESVWLPHFQTVFAQWEGLTGIDFVYLAADDGAGLPDNEGLPGIRADIRIGGHYIDGTSNILAYNFFPNWGDMVIDTGDSYYRTGGKVSDALGLRNILAHEIGHGIGIRHVCPVSGTRLMEPFLSTNFLHAQHDDKRAAWRGYGDDKEDNENPGMATNLGTLQNGMITVGELSIDDDADQDFHKFTVGPGKKVTIRAIPSGASYFSGPQNPDGSCTAGSLVQSWGIHDLALDLRNTDGSSVLASANAFSAGSTEAITNAALPGPGTFFVRVSSVSAVNDVQAYSLEVTVQDTHSLTINDVSIVEGNAGQSNAVLTVTLTPASAQVVTVTAATSNLSAAAGSDYVATGPTTITFAPGETSKPFAVPVIGDTDIEADETFAVTLSNALNAGIADSTGIVTISKDDLSSRTFVSASGVDQGDCWSQTAPCRNVDFAIFHTAVDGEIIILSTGEYQKAGNFSVNKGVKITAAAGTAASFRYAMIVNAPGGRVVVRGLTFHGTGGGSGIIVSAAESVSIEDSTFDRKGEGVRVTSDTPVVVLNSVFRNNTSGVFVSEFALAARVVVEDTRFERNGKGIEIRAGALQARDSMFAGNTSSGMLVGPGVADIFRSEFTANAVGLSTLAGGTARIGRSHIFGNTTGLSAAGGSTLSSFGTNVIRGNGTETSGTITFIPEQ